MKQLNKIEKMRKKKHQEVEFKVEMKNTKNVLMLCLVASKIIKKIQRNRHTKKQQERIE